MNDVSEALVCRVPVTVRRRVKWWECDPGGVVYAGRFIEYVGSVVDFFLRELLGGPTRTRTAEFGFDVPAKAFSLVFVRPLKPEELFDTKACVAKIGRRTFEIEMHATRQDGSPVFQASWTSIAVDASDNTRSIPLPAELRKRLEAYQAACRAQELPR